MREFNNTQWLRLLSEVEALRVGVSSEAVHEFRVAVKKLRAVARTLDVDEAFAPLRPLYRACGRVREPEIMESILKVIDRGTELNTKRLHQRLRVMRAGAIGVVKNELETVTIPLIESVRSKISETMSGKTEDELSKMRRNYIRRCYQRTKKRSKDIDDMEILHDIRVDLKDITYLLGLEVVKTRKVVRRRSLVHDVESFLGAIHDHAVLRAWISEVPEDALDPITRKSLRSTLKTMITTDVRDARVTIASLCRDW